MDGDGDHAPPPPPLLPLPSQASSFLFTPSLPSSSMHPHLQLPPPPLPPLPPLQAQILGDIDWATLLSAQTGLSDLYPRAEGTSSVMAEEEKGSIKDRRKGVRTTRKATRPRFAFQTRSVDDILDDGYRWRKYGQKAVKNSIYPRFDTDIYSHFLLLCMVLFFYCPHITVIQFISELQSNMFFTGLDRVVQILVHLQILFNKY